MNASYSQHQTSYSKFLLFLIVTTLLFLGFTALGPAIMQAAGAIDLSLSHGVAKHGDSAVQVRNCLNDKGAMQEWVNPQTGRRALVCQVGPHTFGMQIIEEREGIWREVTSFIKSKMTRIDQVMNYLRNAGYQPIQ
jgi:hypothetical protein